MNEPPAILDSAQVILFAILDASVRYTGRSYVMVGGVVVDPAPRLAICRNLHDDDILLFLCDDDWNVLGAGGYGTVEKARERAESAYSGVGQKWQEFRALTSEELAEVEETRKFFRDQSIPEFKG
jgi:hypothetical protein